MLAGIWVCIIRKAEKKLNPNPLMVGFEIIDDKYSMEKTLIAIREKLDAESVLVQGKVIGNKLQGNPYKFAENEYELRVFNIKTDGKILTCLEMERICSDVGLDVVPYIGEFIIGLDESLESYVSKSDGKSVLCADAMCGP
ncbi:MAG: hypothetical protein LBU04_05410 [Christensenellaceae bacterium]|nr:hypothetical protein [Christensenellaceae bacterium]